MAPVFETNRLKLTAVIGMESESRVESRRPSVFRGSDGVVGAGALRAAEMMAFVKFPAMKELELALALPLEVFSRFACVTPGDDEGIAISV
ncbi:hypothetical protein FRB91_005785 [Serendipita sp. 411]|nr:hypothetical protein FRB91_005785 [Serendipita sp. 411]